jgi:hypothetical protein
MALLQLHSQVIGAHLIGMVNKILSSLREDFQDCIVTTPGFQQRRHHCWQNAGKTAPSLLQYTPHSVRMSQSMSQEMGVAVDTFYLFLTLSAEYLSSLDILNEMRMSTPMCLWPILTFRKKTHSLLWFGTEIEVLIIFRVTFQSWSFLHNLGRPQTKTWLCDTSKFAPLWREHHLFVHSHWERSGQGLSMDCPQSSFFVGGC